jgi:hypothetical protein
MEQLIGKTFSLHLNASTFLGFSIIHGLELSAGGTGCNNLFVAFANSG